MKFFFQFIIILIVSGLMFYVFSKSKKVPKVQPIQNALIDSMDFDSFKLNGFLPLIALKSDFERGLGKPLKIEKLNSNDVCVTFWNETDGFSYFQGIKCETKKDSIVLTSLDFQENKNCFLSYNSKRFSSETTLDDLKKSHPSMQPYSIAEDKIVVAFKVSKASDDKVLLIFKEGKLIEFEYFMNC